MTAVRSRAAAETALDYYTTCDAKRVTLPPVDVLRHADGFGIVFGAREAVFPPTRKGCRREVFLLRPSRMVMHGDVRAALRAPKTTRMSDA